MKTIYIVVDKKEGTLIDKTDKLEEVYSMLDGDHNRIAITCADDLKQFTITQLVKLYNQLANTDLKKFETKDIAIRRMSKFLSPSHTNLRKEKDMNTKSKTELEKANSIISKGKKKAAVKKKTSNKKSSPKVTTKKKSISAKKKSAAKSASTSHSSRGKSKFEILRNMFSKKGDSHTIDSIMKTTGFDRRNALTAIGILKNPNRTSNPLFIVRNTDTGNYVRSQ